MKKLFFIIALLASCKEAYTPPLKNADYNYLVVEGNIVAGNDPTFIHLTRTTTISDTSKAQPEKNATITVESEAGDSYPLYEQSAGIYTAPPLNINPGGKYRLHIFTSNGKEYASAFVPVIQTPPIDSVSWKVNEKQGVNIYVSTHDATGGAQYYRWKYVATWEHRGVDSSELVYENGMLRSRTAQEQIYRCWTIDSSGTIFLASTTGLSSNVVYEKEMVTIPYDAEEISWVYSILVTQYGLTKEAYQYWDNLKKNTEEIGSIFDPQPFADYGNITCITDPAEPVLGFISACSSQQQRIYIYWSQVRWPLSHAGCLDTLITKDFDQAFSGSAFLPVRIIYMKGVEANLPECIDCRTQGGSTVKPPYMP